MTDDTAADLARVVETTQAIWERKAAYWDERMGEGNAFTRVLVAPATERLLALQPGETMLDVACGNGVISRRLAALGANVVACDFSPTFVERARARSTSYADRISYQVVDATNEEQLRSLGDGRFDAAVCTMALQDMPVIAPLLEALTHLLKPHGRFVFAVPHPAFNIPRASVLGIEEDRGEEQRMLPYVKVYQYENVAPGLGVGMAGEPEPHLYFHRPLHALFGACFAAGFVIDGLEEPRFGEDDSAPRPLGWPNIKHVPPVLVARARRGG